MMTGKGIWLVELPGESIEDAGFGDGVVWIRQRGVRRAFLIRDGSEQATPKRSQNSS
jgi:hypothetical protein